MGGIPHWARVGARVVCVDDAHSMPGRIWYGHIERGAIYTIVATKPGYHGGSAVVLAEAPNIFREAEIGWNVRRFRPLITRSVEHDITEHFKPLLDQRQRERA